nr:ATP-binding protein [Sulfobacillus harzensis]
MKDIAEALNEATDISQAMAAILPRLSQVLGLTTAWAFRFDSHRATFVELGASGLPPALAARDAAALKSSWCECQDRLVNGRLDTAVNIVRCSRLRDARGERAGLKFHASIPMRMNGEPLGILNVAASGARVFTRPALDLLRAIGYHVAVTIDRAAILSDMRQRAAQVEALSGILGDLTGIMHRRELLERAVTLLSDRLGYEAAALLEEGVVVFHVEKARDAMDAGYSYRDVSSEPPDVEPPRILEDALSGLTQAIPRRSLAIRLESRSPRAFSSSDQDLLSAYVWHLAALLDQVDWYHESVASARWSERRELAADLHDSINQRLFSAQLIASALRRQIRDPAGQVLAERLEAVIGDSQQEMKTLVHTLRAESQNLSQALRHRLIRLHQALDGDIRWDIPDLPDTLPPAQIGAVLHIVDEALQNALKHAPGSPIEVRMELEAAAVVIRIRDFGPGFNPALMAANTGHGLATMRERAVLHRIHLAIDTNVGDGTTVRLIIPRDERRSMSRVWIK